MILKVNIESANLQKPLYFHLSLHGFKTKLTPPEISDELNLKVARI